MTPSDPADVSAATRPSWRRRARRLVGWLGVLAVMAAGAALGWSLAPSATAELGPLTLAIDVRPSLDSGAVVELPPVGSVSFDTHTAPLRIEAHVMAVDIDAAQTLISSADALADLEAEAPRILVGALARAAISGVVLAVVGAGVAGFLVYRGRRRTVACITAAAVVIAGLGGATAATFRADAFNQPRFEGLLSQAPYISNQGISALDRLESYRTGLADFVQSVTALYTTSENLPMLPHASDVVVALHVSDIHLNPLAYDLIGRLVDQFAVDVVVDTGDITSWGTAAEIATLAPIGRLKVPYVFVGGNHDSPITAQAVSMFSNAVVLNDEVATVAGLTFAGIADPRFLPDDQSGSGVGAEIGKAAVAAATQQLADTITQYDAAHPAAPVDVALIHDPSHLDPLYGKVPLVLSGHYHRRIDRLDPSGTRIHVEGSTGGAGITARGLERLSEGDPVDMEASLLYFAANGERAGQLLAYDQITVGGLGLAAVNIARTVIDPAEVPGDFGEFDPGGEGPAVPNEPTDTPPVAPDPDQGGAGDFDQGDGADSGADSGEDSGGTSTPTPEPSAPG